MLVGVLTYLHVTVNVKLKGHLTKVGQDVVLLRLEANNRI